MSELDQLAAARSAAGAARRGQVPRYKGITSGAALMRLLAAVLLVTSVLAAFFGVIGVAEASHRGRYDTPEFYVALGLLTGAGTEFVLAVVLSTAAYVALAIRDMAQNSFRR